MVAYGIENITFAAEVFNDFFFFFTTSDPIGWNNRIVNVGKDH